MKKRDLRIRKTRRVTQADRDRDRMNALIGMAKWANATHAQRIRRIRKRPKTWGFDGKSPNTYPRKSKE